MPFSSPDEAIEGGGTIAAGIGPGEQIVLPSQSDGAQRPLGGTVVDLQPAVVDVVGDGTRREST